MDKPIAYSVIIPAYNEEKTVARAIRAPQWRTSPTPMAAHRLFPLPIFQS